MACNEVDLMRRQVCSRLHSAVDHWEHNLKARWGDPAQYAREETQRLRQDARLVYDQNRRTTALLQDAYSKQSEKQRSDHHTRMKKLKPASASIPPR